MIQSLHSSSYESLLREDKEGLIFIINCGSSSIKYQLFQMPAASPVCVGLVERIGQQNAFIRHTVFTTTEPETVQQELVIPDHNAGLQQAVALLTNEKTGVIKSPDAIRAVGHRIVHGGEKYATATVITEKVKADIRELFSLAPLHNPANLTGIEVAEKFFRQATQVAVFDTAFHQTLPEHAFRYAVPQNLYTGMDIRVYGFHGSSHKYVSEQAITYLKNPAAKIISIHLGNGCSMAAIQHGKSIDTSMGFGPLSGLVMGTRSGDIDPSVIFHLITKEGYTADEVVTLLNKKSGMLGLTGFNDMRDVGQAIAGGDAGAELAAEIYTYRIRKYIGAYTAAMNGLDAILFTAGVGENDMLMRKRICTDLDFFGISIDAEKNSIRSGAIREINADNAKVKVLVVPTNEELEIARQTFDLLTTAK